MKILDDITNKVIEGKIAVKISFHCYDLERHCLTIEGKEEPNNFQAKTLFVSKDTARLMSMVTKHLSSGETFDTENYNKKLAKGELDQIKIQFSPTDVQTFPISDEGVIALEKAEAEAKSKGKEAKIPTVTSLSEEGAKV
tara:strand:- start:545 stop:964 length:420 start_codon:yes stop_codon:yes gene_type:complete